MKYKTITIAELIQPFLEENGMKKIEEIYEYVKQFKPHTTKRTVNTTLFSNRHIFNHVCHAIWDVINNSKDERKERTTYKLILLRNHYQEKLEEQGINPDSRWAGVDFNEDEEELLNEIYTKYKKSNLRIL